MAQLEELKCTIDKFEHLLNSSGNSKAQLEKDLQTLRAECFAMQQKVWEYEARLTGLSSCSGVTGEAQMLDSVFSVTTPQSACFTLSEPSPLISSTASGSPEQPLSSVAGSGAYATVAMTPEDSWHFSLSGGQVINENPADVSTTQSPPCQDEKGVTLTYTNDGQLAYFDAYGRFLCYSLD